MTFSPVVVVDTVAFNGVSALVSILIEGSSTDHVVTQVIEELSVGTLINTFPRIVSDVLAR